jgi:hypothetical protein
MADINDLLADDRAAESKSNCGYVLSNRAVFTNGSGRMAGHSENGGSEGWPARDSSIAVAKSPSQWRMGRRHSSGGAAQRKPIVDRPVYILLASAFETTRPFQATDRVVAYPALGGPRPSSPSPSLESIRQCAWRVWPAISARPSP